MVQKRQHFINHFFSKIEISNKKLIRSSGLFLIFQFIGNSGLLELLKNFLKDPRQISKTKYKLSELIVSILLHILDGDKRFSQYRNNPSNYLFKKLCNGSLPQRETFISVLTNRPMITKALNRVLLIYSINQIIKNCQRDKLTKITIDLDQSARQLYGKQAGVEKGYMAKRKNVLCYQFRVWVVREFKMILRMDLFPGSTHSAKNVLPSYKLMCKICKKAGITVLFVGDSGFESGVTCSLIHSYGHQFIFAEKQRQDVKKRGKYSKNKRTHYSGQLVIKERIRPESSRYEFVFREIFVQVHSNDGQLWFEFESDQFTNVFVTNLPSTALHIYKLYKKHAIVETVIEELKNDFGTAIAHSSDFDVNASMTVCTAIAYNIKNSFLVKNKIAIRDQEIMKLSTFQRTVIYTPGTIVKNGNRKILKILPERWGLFNNLLNAA